MPGRGVRTGRGTRRLCAELAGGRPPARPADPYAALCETTSRRRGRPVRFRTPRCARRRAGAAGGPSASVRRAVRDDEPAP
ncbi:hypothetical protein ACFVAF_32285, partial [Streptomyces sp. NPDC057596]